MYNESINLIWAKFTCWKSKNISKIFKFYLIKTPPVDPPADWGGGWGGSTPHPPLPRVSEHFAQPSFEFISHFHFVKFLFDKYDICVLVGNLFIS